jgi:protein SCO1
MNATVGRIPAVAGCGPALLVAVLLVVMASTVRAQPADAVPPELEGVGVTEHVNAGLPLELTFLDEGGKQVRLQDYFDGRRPVILTLNYYRCPMLCTLQLNGLISGLKGLAWNPGGEFEIVTVSFDPQETPALARAKKDNYLADLGKPSAARGWHFLTGDAGNIARLTETVGFSYKWNPARQQWVHVAVLVVCTPDGRISRYLYGVLFDPTTLRLSLVEAGEGKTGSTLDQMLLYCFHYDAAEGKYGMTALGLMRAGGVVTVLVLGTALVTFWVRDVRRRRAAAPAGEP